METDEPPEIVQNPSERDRGLSPALKATRISNDKPTTRVLPSYDYQATLDADTSWSSTLYSKWSQYNVSDGGIPFDLVAPFVQNLPQPTESVIIGRKRRGAICRKLVEVTLARACLLLSGQVQASPGKLEYTFGATLRHRT
jgi:hypothetical protein